MGANTIQSQSSYNAPLAQARQQAARVQPQQPAAPVEAPARQAAAVEKRVEKTALFNGTKTEKPHEESSSLVSNGSNVSLRFSLDEETKKVVAYLIDHETKKVVRTIPPEMLQKLTPGQLLSLTA